MLSRLCLLLRNLHPPSHSSLSGNAMAVRVLPRVIPSTSVAVASISSRSHFRLSPPSSRLSFPTPSVVPSSFFERRFGNGPSRKEFGSSSVSRLFGRVLASRREYRKHSRRLAKRKEKELDLSVNICIEEQLPDDPEVLDIAEMLRLNVPMAIKLALDGLKDSEYKTRDTAIGDVGCFESVELSVLLCNDEFICTLNKEWRDENKPTDVLSMSQHIPKLKLPILMLGDIVISVETAARQAEERGHSLLDEIRILLVHGLLHLLGFDHEISDEAETEMEEKEELLLKSLGWKGKGLIHSAYDADEITSAETKDVTEITRKNLTSNCLKTGRGKAVSDSTDQSSDISSVIWMITPATAQALKEATSRGVKIVIATGKTRPAVINLMKTVDLAGKDGIISEFYPGVFLQGLLVYGRQGREISRRNLDPNICREACLYSIKHKVPLIAFCEDRCLTLFDHPSVESLHTIYYEPKAEIIPSVEQLLAGVEIQKMIFLDTAEGVTSTLRPYWTEASGDYASVVQAVPDMLEIVPSGTSKGRGVQLLLDHLDVSPKEIMAIGDGENDVEMLKLASLGVALSNGSEKAKAVANVIGSSNDEDGAADAIYRYAF